MPNVHTCERPGCLRVFDRTDHPQQRFCSKSCAKQGTQHRHQGAESSRPGAMAQALAAVERGMSFRAASLHYGVPASTLHLAAQRQKAAPN